MSQTTTSGTPLLDELIDGVHVGDNLVVVGAAGTPVELLVSRFIAAARGEVPLVVVRLLDAPEQPVPDGIRVVDWSPATTGRRSMFEDSIAPDAGFTEALAGLEAIDDELGSGAAFVFDPLAAVPDRWGPDAALELFLAICPRLYRRRSLAVWPIQTDQHRPSFLRRLEEITQVVVQLDGDDGRLRLTVRKADGRRPDVVGRSIHAEVVDGDLRPTDSPVTARARLGGAVRDQRLARGLSQTELARRVGITPSALSQVERGVRGPSGDTLVRLWEVLEVPFGPESFPDRGYRVSRRSGRERVRLQEGLHAERVADGPQGDVTWMLELDPGASGDRQPFAVKSAETVVVLRGVLDLQLEGRTETFHEGDAVVLTAAALSGWANPGPHPTELLWSLGPAS